METGKELSSEEQVQLANVDETCKEIEESSKAQELRNSPEGEAVIDTVLPDGWTCRACGQQNAPGEDKCTNKNCAVIDERLEVENNNLITEYPTFHDFETKILQEAYSVSANTRIRKKCGKNRDWQPLNMRLAFLTNNFAIPAMTVAELYRCRWQVELFFRWLKQHLRIKAFYGTSENAVLSQVWIALSVYVLVAIMKKKLHLTNLSLYTILQILSVSLFEKKPILSALVPPNCTESDSVSHNQLDLFKC